MAAAASPALAGVPHHGDESGPSRQALAQTVTRAQGGDMAAFESLYRSCSPRIYALCLRLTADRSRAEMATQDVFVRAWQKLGTYRGDSAFTTWLHRLAVNVVLQERRSEMRRKQREQADAERRPDAQTPHRAVDAGVDLERAIAELPERARAVLVLHDIEGYQHQEIAQMMDVAVGTSKAQLHRARKMLREVLT